MVVDLDMDDAQAGLSVPEDSVPDGIRLDHVLHVNTSCINHVLNVNLTCINTYLLLHMLVQVVLKLNLNLAVQYT